MDINIVKWNTLCRSTITTWQCGNVEVKWDRLITHHVINIKSNSNISYWSVELGTKCRKTVGFMSSAAQNALLQWYNYKHSLFNFQ